MRQKRLHVAVGLLILLSLVAGCMTVPESRQTQDVGTAWPLDSLAYIYTDPAAVSPVNDHPLRWLAFLLHPVGVVLDYGINRPLYAFTSLSPTLFGFTPEDATLHAQRPQGAYQNN